jgi:hypothetical protein
MTGPDVEKLFSRIARLKAAIAEKRGAGAEWDYSFPDGTMTTYRITKVKPPEVVADELEQVFVWAWTLKDYLKELAASAGRPAQSVENLVNSDSNLQLCADLANREKHARLKQSRSGKFAKLGKPRYTVPQEGIGALLVTPSPVVIDVSKPELVELRVPIENELGAVVGDALDVLDGVVGNWEQLFADLSRSPQPSREN